jgi:uncharacterized membrane protein
LMSLLPGGPTLAVFLLLLHSLISFWVNCTHRYNNLYSCIILVQQIAKHANWYIILSYLCVYSHIYAYESILPQ